MTKTLTRQNCNGIDASDPWRYTCPHCGAHLSTVRRRVGVVRDKAVNGHIEDPDARYYCDGCKTALRELYDKKIEENVHVGTCNRALQ